MNENLREQARKLAARPYTVKVVVDDSVSDEPLYLALNPELEGCMAQGETIEQAKAYLEEFRVNYIEHLLKHGLPVPDPAPVATVTSGTKAQSAYGLTLRVQSHTFEGVFGKPADSQEGQPLLEYSFKTS